MAANGGRRKSVSGSVVKPPPPPKLAKESLHRTLSDISLDFKRGGGLGGEEGKGLVAIAEVEKAKCECCGMREECTMEYIERVREKFLGRWICGLCSEAVKEEREKKEENGLEGALKEHMSACLRFNKLGREYPALFQAEAMRDMLRRSTRGQSISPQPTSTSLHNKPAISRTSSCIPAITRDLH
ncbi:hypothetical protein EUTSA_v10019197mg [Eutrema salsugineum]|uniref:DUF1677 domain-containing protein n=1 Tax=Eutrema salsugineum TaxID=72664 RepID=V4M7E5_EUTSA|nr:uncharacterized protein LOC18008753 [Eutrema salsugineum]ESQ27016.1 hypothetical protein EUTSA_v10019197mg [Eutrema salsugineum]